MVLLAHDLLHLLRGLEFLVDGELVLLLGLDVPTVHPLVLKQEGLVTVVNASFTIYCQLGWVLERQS